MKNSSLIVLIVCVIWAGLFMSDIAKAKIPVFWQADPNGSGVVNNSISRIKLTPDNDNVMVFHYNGDSYGIPTRVDKLNASTGDHLWTPYKEITKSGERISLNGWVDSSGNLYIMPSWSGYTIWKYNSEFDTELCSYTGGSGFEYVYDIITDEFDNIYATGLTGSFSNQGSRLVKLDNSCNEIWTCLSHNTSGKDQYSFGIALDSSKNVFRVGTDDSSGASDRGRLIGHNDSNGVEFLNYTVNETNSRISGITIDSNNFIYIAYCYDYTPTGSERTVVQKLEPNGSTADVIWEYRFDDIGMYVSRDAIVKHTGDSFYVAFNQRQDATTVPGIAEFDLDGNLLWKDTVDRPGWYLSSGIDAEGDNIYMGLTKDGDGSKTQVLCLAPQFTYYVCVTDGSDLNDGRTCETAFKTIQRGIDVARDGDTVIACCPGVYAEELDALGKAITVRSLDEPAVITAPDGYGILFVSGEDADTVFENFIISGSDTGIGLIGSSPTLNHFTVADNNLGAIADEFSFPIIENSIFWNNVFGDLLGCDASYSWSVEDNNHFIAEWGGTGSGDGQLDTPYGIAVNSLGDIYVADYGNHRVSKFTSDGIFVGWFGGCAEHGDSIGHWHDPCSGHTSESGSGAGEFNYPIGVAIDPLGDIYVSDHHNHRVQKFDGISWSTFAGTGSIGSGDGEFKYPYHLTIDPSGYVYVVDHINYRIQKFDSTGSFVGWFGGCVEHGDSIGHWHYPGSGHTSQSGAGQGEFDQPIGISHDALGNIYVADNANHRIEIFTSSGNFAAEWNINGSGDGQFSFPTGITLDSSGYVYVADRGNARIQKFTSNGSFITKWGVPGSSNGQFTDPADIAVDSSGNIFVTDFTNDNIQKFQLPLFVDANNGDYRLKSERGRYWPEHDIWVLDTVTSPCVDAGDSNIQPANERMPNGGRINQGAYGNTSQASMSEWPLKHDSSRNGMVNFVDFAQMADEWLEYLPWAYNESPEVSITSPEQGEMVPYNTIDPVIIEVDASDSDGSVLKVEFFANGDKVAEDTSGYDGWQGPWHPVSDGDFTLTARAMDDEGASASSDAIDITIGYVY